ncbi:MAG: 50S ribosomal protein L21, partial [Rhodospirillales bacterium]|nr:50S ribosomal protein L21 [Rhodospirillales bacterium]
MFAVIKTGGKQYRVAQGDVIVVEKLLGEAGASVKLDQVLMLGEDGKAPTVGQPVIANATVTAEVVEQGRGDKVVVFKKKRRKRYTR